MSGIEQGNYLKEAWLKINFFSFVLVAMTVNIIIKDFDSLRSVFSYLRHFLY